MYRLRIPPRGTGFYSTFVSQGAKRRDVASSALFNDFCWHQAQEGPMMQFAEGVSTAMMSLPCIMENMYLFQ